TPAAAATWVESVQRPQKRTSTHRRVLVLVALAVLTLALITGGVGWSIRQSRRREVSESAPAIQLKRLTYDSKAFGPAVSPSGEFVAYRFHDGAQDSIKLKNVANGSTVQIMPPIKE